MSQAGILTVGAVPIVATEFTADVGSATPALNILNIYGGEGIDTTGAGNTITIIGELATAGINVGATNLGICSFDSADFTVVGGFVQISGAFVGGIITLLTDSGLPGVPGDLAGQVSVFGGEGIDVAGTGPGTTVTISGEIATAAAAAPLANLGICSFDSAQFTVTGGFVQTAGGIATTYRAENATTCTPAAGVLTITGTATNGINTTAAGSTMTVHMASPYADGNFIFENNAAATPRALSVENNDNDPGSYAALAVSTEPGGGDAFVFWEIDAATRYYSMGVDNSVANDPFKFTSSVSPSGGADIFSADVATNTFTHSYGNIIQTRAYVANGVNTIIQNTDNTNIASDAFLRLHSGGAAAGDPFIAFLVNAAGKYAMGIDNTDNDYWKFTDGNTPSDGTNYAVLNPTILQWQLPVWEVQQQLTRIGDNIWHHLYNLDNTNGASQAYMQIETGGANSGDPFINFLVNGLGTYSVGIDNSVVGDPFKITTGASPSLGVDLFAMTSTGVITLNNDLDVTEGGTGVSTLTSHGILMGNGAGDIQATAEPTNGQLLIGKTGDFPQLAQLQPGMGIAISSGAGSITIGAWGGGVSWTVETVDLSFTANKGIIANKAGLLTVTLPATGTIGDILEITGINTAVGWRVAQNANQQIYFGTLSTTVGIGGYIESVNIHDAIKLLCVVAGASTRWQALSSIGNLTVV